MITSSRRAALLALGMFATNASVAHAASYEQLSRDTGRTGASSLAPSFAIFALTTGAAAWCGTAN